MNTAPQTVTRLLGELSAGKNEAFEELVPVLYGELKGIARGALRKLPAGETLQATALVNEAYLKLANAELDFENRRHFFYAAARAMRDVLVDEARRKASLKRGAGWNRSDPSQLTVATEVPALDLLALEEALVKLGSDDPDGARLVELVFFAGLSQEEAASVMGVSTRTVQRDWRHIRARLFRELTKE